ETYRALVDHSLQGLIIFQDRRIVFANQSFAKISGYTVEELLSLSPDEVRKIIHPEDHANVWGRYQDRLAGKIVPSRYEFRGIRKNGSVRWSEMHASLIEYRGKPAIQAAILDITERVKAAEALRQRNRELALLNQISETFVSTLDLDQVLTLVLEEVRRLLGVVACSAWLIDAETDELVCRQVTDPQSEIVRGWRLAPGQGLVGWVVQHGQSLNVSDTRTEEQHFKGVDEQTGLVLRSILSVPLRAKKGVIGVIQVVDEVVSRFTPADLQLVESLAATTAIAIENARLYESAQVLHKQTQQDAETKAMLLREVNHRVKNNLAAIAGILYIEKRHAEQSSDWRAYQTLIDDLINRIEGLATVHRLLSASEWSPLPLSELVEQVIHSALQTLPPDKHVLTDVSASSIQVTPKQANNLAMVINELTTNIVKYALPERETIRITIHITLEDETILFEFRDDGPGFPVEVLDLEHWNVGMYLVQNIVCGDLRGEITLFNDNGAVITIRFPASVEVNNNERIKK
ncbi:PAS domain S-box protein, partial [Chloroflexota bacterium]